MHRGRKKGASLLSPKSARRLTAMGEKSCEGCTHRGSWSVDDYGIIWGSDIECSDCARFPRDDCFKLSPDFKPRPEVKKP